jgi:cytochrome oxidase Cu insertion factor (SCO1/SenC/PrrC family)
MRGMSSKATSAHILGVLTSALVFAVACGESSDQRSLSEGAAAPNFTLPSAAGEKVALSDYAGEKPVLLYFSMGPG